MNAPIGKKTTCKHVWVLFCNAYGLGKQYHLKLTCVLLDLRRTPLRSGMCVVLSRRGVYSTHKFYFRLSEVIYPYNTHNDSLELIVVHYICVRLSPKNDLPLHLTDGFNVHTFHKH